ncbi:MAG: anti-sigma factor [Hydrogenophaga sp.]|nr:anti-sigma factor [Hydrogenophaga sp.]
MNTPPTSLPDSPRPPVRVSRWWRALAYFLGLMLLLGVATTFSLYEQLKAQIQHLQTRVAQVPQVRYISVLLDAQQQPAMLVTLDPQSGALQLQRLNDVAEGREDSMQLWALVPDQPPRSLGVVESKYKTLQLTATEAALANATQLAISVEDKGGVSQSQGPRLPYLFTGWLVRKAI